MIDLLQINERSEYQKYFDLFVTHGFFPKITVPTRCCQSSSSLFDQMFCKLKDPKQHLSSCVVESCISDHFPYLSIFDILKKTRHVPKFVQINRTDANSFQAFHNEIELQFDTLKMDRDLFWKLSAFRRNYSECKSQASCFQNSEIKKTQTQIITVDD